MLAEIKSRYNFQHHAEQAAEASNNITFKVGSWKGLQIDEFGVYSDGFIVSGKNSTDIFDEFIDDLHQVIRTKFGILMADQPPPVRVYESIVVVEINPKLEKNFDLLSGLYKDLDALNESYQGNGANYRLGGFHVEAESAQHDSRKPPTFTLVRRVGVKFDSGYWYSSAGLKTDDHLAVLKNLEERSLK